MTPPGRAMCRYAVRKYKPHYVCFDCRKQFKRPSIWDVLEQQGKVRSFRRLLAARASGPGSQGSDAATTVAAMEQTYRALISTCPQCGVRMADLGLDFKPPRLENRRAWLRLRAMYKLGRTWQTCGCNGPGFIPVNQTDYAAYLRDLLAEYAEKVSQAQASTTLAGAQRSEAVRYWKDRVARVRRLLDAR